MRALRLLRLSLPVILLILVNISPDNHAAAQTEPAQIEPAQPVLEYKFDEWIRISATVPQDSDVKSVQAFIQTVDGLNTWPSQPVQPEAGHVSFEFVPQEMGLRAFSNLSYWIETTLQDGETNSSPKLPFYYDDNRFEWKTRTQEPFEAFWHEGDSSFGLSLLGVAQQGLTQVQTLLPLPSPELIRIYAYADAVDMRATFRNNGRSWVGAHTDPDLGVMVASLPPGPEQRLEMERQIPHELMHILLYQKVGPAYVNLPAWLNEGLASIAELYPNPDYQILLESAYENGTLFPMSSLCIQFPVDAAGAYLAYAQAASFTRYIQEQYGSVLIDQLVRQYANGLDCERGMEVALGTSMSQLERDWRRQILGEDPWLTALINLAPWLLILGAILAVPIVMVIVTLRRSPPARTQNSR